MNSLISVLKNAQRITLDELFAEAMTYGRPYIYQMNDGEWAAKITFATISGISLEAKNNMKDKDPHSAMRAAIEAAKTVKTQFK